MQYRENYERCTVEKGHMKEELDACVSAEGSKTATTHLLSAPNSNPNPAAADTSMLEKWLVIGIPTVGRAKDLPYLLESLDTLDHQVRLTL